MSRPDSVRRGVTRFWRGWTRIAHAIGMAQARVLLTLFYLLIAPPFALVAKLLIDPLGLRSTARASYWSERPERPASERAATRQF